MENINIFEQASRKALRFNSLRGLLTAEQLWDLKLSSKDSFDLDSVGQIILTDLESTTTKSLVKTAPNPKASELELKLEIVKHIIAIKQAEAAAKAEAADKAAKRAKLIDLLGKKEDAALENLSPDEIKAQIAALS